MFGFDLDFDFGVIDFIDEDLEQRYEDLDDEKQDEVDTILDEALKNLEEEYAESSEASTEEICRSAVDRFNKELSKALDEVDPPEPKGGRTLL
jgi:hypothetical protein